MAGITLAQAEAQLDEALAALSAARNAQQYSISTGTSSRQLSRAALSALEASVDKWETKVQQLSRGGIRVRSASPF